MFVFVRSPNTVSLSIAVFIPMFPMVANCSVKEIFVTPTSGSITSYSFPCFNSVTSISSYISAFIKYSYLYSWYSAISIVPFFDISTMYFIVAFNIGDSFFNIGNFSTFYPMAVSVGPSNIFPMDDYFTVFVVMTFSFTELFGIRNLFFAPNAFSVSVSFLNEVMTSYSAPSPDKSMSDAISIAGDPTAFLHLSVTNNYFCFPGYKSFATPSKFFYMITMVVWYNFYYVAASSPHYFYYFFIPTMIMAVSAAFPYATSFVPASRIILAFGFPATDFFPVAYIFPVTAFFVVTPYFVFVTSMFFAKVFHLTTYSLSATDFFAVADFFSSPCSKFAAFSISFTNTKFVAMFISSVFTSIKINKLIF
jgi:hypothetical protein